MTDTNDLPPDSDLKLLDTNPGQVEMAVRQQLRHARDHNQPTADLETSLAVALMFQRRLSESRQLVRSVLHRHPQHIQALWCDAVLALYMQEPWSSALVRFQARWAVGINGDRPIPLERTWDGSPLNGRTVLFAGEGGRGDQIQFLRFVPSLKAAGAGKVIVAVRPDIMQLANSVEGVDAVVSSAPESNQLDAPVDYDTGLPMMNAPGLLGLTYETVPAPVPYIHLPEVPMQSAHQKFRSAPVRPLNVGLCRTAAKEYRTLPLELFRPLSQISGVRLFSLAQFSPQEAETAPFPISPLGTCDIVGDGAALCALDLVISVDTMIAHLAGSLARPVWLLLSFLPDCRWGLESQTTRWYPTMRIFRRDRLGWESVIHTVAAELAHLAHARQTTGLPHTLHSAPNTHPQESPLNQPTS